MPDTQTAISCQRRNSVLPTCTTRATLTLLATIACCMLAHTPAQAAHPACSSPVSDSDGDGWGWENDRTCVLTSEGTPSAPGNASGGTGGSGLPVCSSAGSDPDGDGYGWENDASCQVAASDTAVPTGSGISPSNQTNPVCTDSNSDPDGDGYGWENDRTCLIIADSSSPSSDQPAPLTPDPLRFMAVGDSITHGVARDSAKSYRHDLTSLLDRARCSYTMVGSQQGNLGHRTFVSPHEGYNGHRADHFLTGLDNYAGNNEGVSVAVNRYRPDLVLLHLGTNDMLQNQNVADTVAEIDQIISTILDSGADVLVANVIPVFGYGAQTRTQQLGNQLQSYVAQLGNSRVRIVDVRSGFTNAMMLSDNLHPNQAGEAHIARAFYNAILSGGHCARS